MDRPPRSFVSDPSTAVNAAARTQRNADFAYPGVALY
jgi:hypothetical protein